MKKLLACVVLCGCMSVAFADASKKDKTCKHSFSPTTKDWSLDLQLGFNKNTGNSVNTNLNTAVNTVYSPDRWEFILDFTSNFESQDNIRSAEKYTEGFQTRFHHAPKENYVYALANAVQNSFGTYDRTVIASLGYGWTIVDNCDFYFVWQVGPGMRYQRDSGTQKSETRPVGFTGLDFSWYITPYSTLREQFNLEYGSANTYYQTITSINTKLIKNFGIKALFEADYNTNVPRGSSNRVKLNTTSIVALTYTFKM